MERTHADRIDDHRAARRTDLLAKAAQSIDRRGLRSAPIAAIAQDVGVAKVVLYRYFGSKDALVDAVLADIVDALLECDAMPAADWTQRLPHTLALAQEKRAALRILLRQAPNDPRFGAHVERLHDTLAGRTIDRIAATLGPPRDMPGDPAMLARMIAVFLLDAYLRWVDGGTPGSRDAFLAWLAASVRAMARGWWSGEDR